MPLIDSDSTFPSPAGPLYRRSIAPDSHPRATLAIIHGYGDHCGRHAHVMRFLAEHGNIATHGFDFQGQGRSPGPRGFVRDWSDYLADLDAFLAQPDIRSAKPLFLLGHSHGALILCAAVTRAGANSLSNVTGCILTSPFLRNRMRVPRYKTLLARAVNPVLPWLRLRSGLADGMMTSDESMIADTKADPLVTRVATPRWYFGSLAAQRRVIESASNFRLPLLMLLGSLDPVADLAVAERFFAQATSTDKQLKTYPGLLHELLRESRRQEVLADILSWLSARA
jgi:alpha-beta hydrolase superfamily lysophospholipase